MAALLVLAGTLHLGRLAVGAAAGNLLAHVAGASVEGRASGVKRDERSPFVSSIRFARLFFLHRRLVFSG